MPFGMYRRIHKGPLGWKVPEDRSYMDKYPLTAATLPSTAHPVVLGIPWYSTFDTPTKIGDRYWIGRQSNIGYVRGGHAICVQPGNSSSLDMFLWWRFYNQGTEGACVGFSLSRALSLMNRSRYDAFWLYHEAQKIDEWTDTPPEEGTSVNAGCEILMKRGARRYNSLTGKFMPENIISGIQSYRWAKSVDDIHAVLQHPVADALGAVPLLNSWGTNYPRKVWIPDNVLDRIVFYEGGEAAVLTDRLGVEV
jgi:hypothetical protein